MFNKFNDSKFFRFPQFFLKRVLIGKIVQNYNFFFIYASARVFLLKKKE